MITTYQVGLIKAISQYISTCSGVYYRRDQFKHWGAKFEIKGISIPLGFFEREEEAIKVYNDYHEKFYQDLLTKIKEEKDEKF